MKKEEIRKEFFKLRIKHHSYSQCRKILKAKYGYRVTLRTLYRWTKRINETEWDLIDYSKRPKKIHFKITPRIEDRIIENESGLRQSQKTRKSSTAIVFL